MVKIKEDIAMSGYECLLQEALAKELLKDATAKWVSKHPKIMNALGKSKTWGKDDKGVKKWFKRTPSATAKIIMFVFNMYEGGDFAKALDGLGSLIISSVSPKYRSELKSAGIETAKQAAILGLLAVMPFNPKTAARALVWGLVWLKVKGMTIEQANKVLKFVGAKPIKTTSFKQIVGNVKKFIRESPKFNKLKAKYSDFKEKRAVKKKEKKEKKAAKKLAKAQKKFGVTPKEKKKQSLLKSILSRKKKTTDKVSEPSKEQKRRNAKVMTDIAVRANKNKAQALSPAMALRNKLRAKRELGLESILNQMRLDIFEEYPELFEVYCAGLRGETIIDGVTSGDIFTEDDACCLEHIGARRYQESV